MINADIGLSNCTYKLVQTPHPDGGFKIRMIPQFDDPKDQADWEKFDAARTKALDLARPHLKKMLHENTSLRVKAERFSRMIENNEITDCEETKTVLFVFLEDIDGDGMQQLLNSVREMK